MTKLNPAELLKKYEDEGYNILTPSITLEGLSPHHHATVETVQLSHDKEVGDVYPHASDDEKTDKTKYRIAKQGLDKLAVLAGVIWHQQGGSVRVDDRKDRDYVAFEAFGAIRKADGQLVPVKAFYDLDFITIEEDVRANYEAKAKNWKKDQDYVEYCVGRDMRSKRKHRATLCESGARNRVIRALLGIKKVYTVAELKKPFVCVRITYQPDYDDPEVKRIITLASLGAQASVYGIPGPPPMPQITQAEYITAPDEDGDTQDGDVVDTEPNGVDDEEPPGAGEDFENWDRKSQITELQTMAKMKAYDLDDLLKRMDTTLLEFRDDQMISLFEKLADLPDDDIPF